MPRSIFVYSEIGVTRTENVEIEKKYFAEYF